MEADNRSGWYQTPTSDWYIFIIYKKNSHNQGHMSCQRNLLKSTKTDIPPVPWCILWWTIPKASTRKAKHSTETNIVGPDITVLREKIYNCTARLFTTFEIICLTWRYAFHCTFDCGSLSEKKSLIFVSDLSFKATLRWF